VYFQVMLGKSRPDTMGYADEQLYQRRDAHLTPDLAGAKK
jgi:hypothetical protein